MDLDLRDDVLQAERQTGVIEQFENAKGTGQKQPSAGVNTGIGPDIKEQVKNKEKHNPQLN